MVAVASSVSIPAEVISTPGAKRSTHEPWLLQDAAASASEVAPTVIASGARAGENWQASAPLFPAATA